MIDTRENSTGVDEPLATNEVGRQLRRLVRMSAAHNEYLLERDRGKIEKSGQLLEKLARRMASLIESGKPIHSSDIDWVRQFQVNRDIKNNLGGVYETLFQSFLRAARGSEKREGYDASGKRGDHRSSSFYSVTT